MFLASANELATKVPLIEIFLSREFFPSEGIADSANALGEVKLNLPIVNVLAISTYP
jgi:hypothetical protein